MVGGHHAALAEQDAVSGRSGDRALSGPSWDAAVPAVLIVVTTVLSWQHLPVHYWTDEGIAVAIADLPAHDIPGALRFDVSPPLYYLLLHGWIRMFGDGAVATHSLSLIFACGCIVAAWWLGRRLMGQRLAVLLPIVVTAIPDFSFFAVETRMYSLAMLEGIVLVTLWFELVEGGRARVVAAFSALSAALMLTHNWGIVVVAALAVASLYHATRCHDTSLIIRHGCALVAAVMAYSFWLPTLWRQMNSAPAPWLPAKGPLASLGQLASTLIEPTPLLALGIGLPVLFAFQRVRLRETPWVVTRQPAGSSALLVGLAVILTLVWIVSQGRHLWFPRYLFVVAAPVVLVGCLALSRLAATWLLAIGLFGSSLINAVPSVSNGIGLDEKSEARLIAKDISRQATPGDVVIISPARLSLTRLYLGSKYHYLTTLGPPDADTGLINWRHRLERYRDGSASDALSHAISRLRLGQRVIVARDENVPAAAVEVFHAQYDAMSAMATQLEHDRRLSLASRATHEYAAFPGESPVEITTYVRRGRDSALASTTSSASRPQPDPNSPGHGLVKTGHQPFG